MATPPRSRDAEKAGADYKLQSLTLFFILVSLAATGRFTFTELCADYHVGRKTGHKWWRRFCEAGTAGLQDRSRRPHGCAHQTALRIAQLILRERRKHRTWGPKKLRRLLRRDHGIRRPPACSTIAGILRRSGLSFGLSNCSDEEEWRAAPG